MTNTVHIMVAFVSQVAYTPSNINYHSVDDKQEFTCLQTNEAAICQLQELLADEGGLAKIILIETEKAREEATRSTKDWQDWMVLYGCEKMSAVDFLKKQTARKYPSLAEVFEDSPYAEDMGIEDSMRSIAAIAAHVRAFADHVRRENPAAAVVLHADMTGGFRYAAMMLLVVMQLSKYMGIRMGHVVYSDLVKDGISRIHLTDDIHRMFDLAAGADEFQKYGSVQALEEYFARSPRHSEDFSVLFAAMRRFSDAIRICRTSIIEKELESLGEHIRVFRNQSGDPIQEELFRRIIRVLEREYGTVLGSGTSEERRLNIIAWCLRKKFLQQAMTLCTEWIPQIIVNKRICYTEDIFAIRDCKKAAKKGLRSWQQEFIISYDPERKRKEKEKVPYGDALDMFRYILKYNRKDLLVELPDDLQRILHSFLQDHSRNLSIYTNKDILLEPISTNNAALRRAIDQLKKNAKQQNKTKGLLYPTIPNRVGQLSEKRVTEIFGLSAADIAHPTKTPAPQLTDEEQRAQKWAKREAIYRRMFSDSDRIMRSDLPLDAALDYLRSYFDIREERNQSNHAVVTADQESSKLEEDITAYIEKLHAYQRAVTP